MQSLNYLKKNQMYQLKMSHKYCFYSKNFSNLMKERSVIYIEDIWYFSIPMDRLGNIRMNASNKMAANA